MLELEVDKGNTVSLDELKKKSTKEIQDAEKEINKSSNISFKIED
jgi:hypothetical protein